MKIAKELLYRDRRGVDFLNEFRDDLARTVSYHFLTEDGYGTDADDPSAAAAADILALICEHYDINPGVNRAGVRQWRAAFNRYMDENYAIDEKRDSPDGYNHFRERRRIVNGVFDRLEALVARYDSGIYPPQETSDWTPDKE